MVLLTAVLALALVGTSIVLAVRAAALPRVRVVEHLEAIGAYGFTTTADADARPRVLARLAARTGGMLEARLTPTRREDLRRTLLGAGLYEVEVCAFLGYRALCTAVLAAVLLLLSTSAGFPLVVTLLVAVYAVGIGWVAPLLVVRRRSRARLEEIDRRMPELVDLLIVTVEAGGGFNAAMQLASERVQGALGEELRLANQEQNLGLSSAEALDNLLARCETPSVRSFVRSIRQGEGLGVSIGTILRNLTGEMRKRRRAQVEERAQKAPIKMLFPLVFLIFPALFIVVLFPAVWNFATTFGS